MGMNCSLCSNQNQENETSLTKNQIIKKPVILNTNIN